MTIKTVLKIGEPGLSEKSARVENFHSPELKQLIEDMKETQKHYDRAGISAPQIGVNLRVILFGFEHCARYPEREAITETLLINPEYTPLSEEKNIDWERCLSVPDVRGLVSRFTKITYTGFDQKGKFIERKAEGFHARVIQHEIDHIDGILFVDRMEPNEKK